MSFDPEKPQRYAVSTRSFPGRTSCHQSGPKEVRSEKSFWYAFSIILNEDDIRKQLSELNLRPEKLRRGQEIKIDIYIEETRKN